MPKDCRNCVAAAPDMKRKNEHSLECDEKRKKNSAVVGAFDKDEGINMRYRGNSR